MLTKYPLSQDRIVVFEIGLHSKSPMLYRPALHGNWNTFSLASRTLKDKFPTPTVLLTTVLQNRQVFLPDPTFADDPTNVIRLMVRRLVAGCCSSHRFLLVFPVTAIETLNTLITCRTDHRYVRIVCYVRHQTPFLSQPNSLFRRVQVTRRTVLSGKGKCTYCENQTIRRVAAIPSFFSRGIWVKTI